MTDKASPAGWVVQLTIPALPSEDARSRWVGRLGLGPPSFRYFNVAIAAPFKAIEATKEHLAGSEDKDREMSVVRGLSEPEIAALNLNVGEVKPA
jgi:hypothetical protein